MCLDLTNRAVWPEQIKSIFDFLVGHSQNPEILRRKLAEIELEAEAPIIAVLYLPLYSFGLGSTAITPRISWLVANNWGVSELAAAGDVELDQISSEVLPSGKLFGLRDRLVTLATRAREIVQFGPLELARLLSPTPNWGCRELLLPLRKLRKFSGIGSAAALHILMALNWGVVKPDRHICRFLSRLGGRWDSYFEFRGSELIDEEARLPLLEDWREACAELRSSAAPVVVQALSPRQVDILIMWFTQNVASADAGWRPNPVCTSTPQCRRCPVTNCASRAELQAVH